MNIYHCLHWAQGAGGRNKPSNIRVAIRTFLEKVATAEAKWHALWLTHPRSMFCSHLPFLLDMQFTKQQNRGCSCLQVTGSLACAAVEFWLYFTKDSFIYIWLTQAQLEADFSFSGFQYKHSWQLSILGADWKTDCFVVAEDCWVNQRTSLLRLNFSLQKAGGVALFFNSVQFYVHHSLQIFDVCHTCYEFLQRDTVFWQEKIKLTDTNESQYPNSN